MLSGFYAVFGADKIDFSDLSFLENDSANLILYAIPVRVLLTIIEICRIGQSHANPPKIIFHFPKPGCNLQGETQTKEVLKKNPFLTKN